MEFVLVFLFCLIPLSTSDTFSVKIEVQNHVNVVDSRFLSFTIDPKYLFSSSEKYKSKECICMASSLTPAYIRIAGPSTSSMTFQNATIAINELDEDKYQEPRSRGRLAVSHRKWRKFVQWAKSTGFDLVFALNNEEKTSSGMWDPNTALNILTVAEKANIDDIFWQLGYECNHQSIEEYLNDLETLRVIIETFAPGRAGSWQVVGGDVSNCLHADSKSDFKDYVSLSDDMMDAIMLNGNSSSYELLRMSEVDRLKLLRRLSQSTTPLWLTENPRFGDNEVERAADWLSSLGYSARNGFSVHFRELLEEEMYEPTMSFYMALLFKNLVGERVLDVELESDQSVLFAHCTSLRHKAVPGAVTIYGANMDDEIARFSIKMSNREEGGDIMQFVIGQDHNGNIIVNGRPMNFEGDIKPVVKRVRPYKTLLINLPPKSFGFWVLANTNIEACQYTDVNNETSEPKISNDSEGDSEEVIRKKRVAQCLKDKLVENDNGESENVGDVDTAKCINSFLSTDLSITNHLNHSLVSAVKSVNNTHQTEDDIVISDILDLDNITEVKIYTKTSDKVQEKNSDIENDLDITRKKVETGNGKKKRNTDEKDTTRTDNAASSSVTNNAKAKRLDDRARRRQSLTAPKEKIIENTKTSKLRRSEDVKMDKIERLKTKLFKTDRVLEGKSRLLDNILARRKAKHKNERRKFRFGKNKISKRNSRITRKSDSYKNNNVKEEKAKRFRRNVDEPIYKPIDMLLNNSNENNTTTQNSTRVTRNAYIENREHQKLKRSHSVDRDAIDRQINNDKINGYESGPEDISDKVSTQHRHKERNHEKNQNSNNNNKILRNGRSTVSKHISEDVLENEIENDDIDNTKLWKILRKIHKQLKDLSTEKDYDTNDELTIDDDQIGSKEDSGIIKSTVNNLLRVLRELNKNLNRFWNGVNLLD